MIDCIFCKIVDGEIPCFKLYEDEHCLAFLDIRPSTKGHSLVIPKKHFDNWTETPEKVLAEIARVSKIVATAALKGLGADGFNIGVNTGAAAGQIIMHTHLHVMPRYLKDGLRLWPSLEATSDVLKEIATIIISEIK